MLKKFIRHPISHLLLVLLFGFLAYANTFGGPFVLDDLESIVRNDIIRDLGNFLPGGSAYDFLPRRWIGYFTLALNYRFGGLDVTGYHLFNLAVHLCNALLVYVLVRLTFRTPKLTESRLLPRAGAVALLAALVFVVHPVQTQAVTYIVQRLASLCTLFFLLALVLYLAARLRLDKQPQQGEVSHTLTAGGWRGVLLLAGSLLATLLAMYTKEIAFTLPLVILLYEASFFRGGWRRRLLFLLPLLLTLPLIPYNILVADSGASLASGAVDLEQQFRAQTDLPRLHYLFTQFRVIVTYLRLLILPVAQNVDYDYPIYTTFFAAPVFLSFLLLVAIGSLAAYLFHRSCFTPNSVTAKSDPAVRLVAFGIAWFFLTSSIESGLIPLADVIFEHRLYLPSIGLIAAFAVAVCMATRRTTNLFKGQLPLLACALAIAALAIGTWQRNQVWQDEVLFWEEATRKSPGKYRPWYNLGTQLADNGRLEESIAALLWAVTIDPQQAEGWHNLGRTYLLSNRIAEALPALRTAFSLDPNMENIQVNLAVALIHAGDPAAAIPLLESARQSAPDRVDVRNNLGIAYVDVGNIPKAKLELAALSRLAPSLARELASWIDRNSPRSLTQ